jgi:hypothetical protein
MHASATAFAITVCSLATGGCALGGDKVSDVPAVIERPTDASRAELLNIVNTAVGTQVTLAPDALTRESTLSIERTPIRDSSGRRVEVRERTGPELFRLVKRGDQCVLIHERTKAETVLRATQCAAT